MPALVLGRRVVNKLLLLIGALNDLAAGTLAFALRLKASENYWDYLIDPLLTGYCLVAGLWMLAMAAWRPLLKLHRGQ